MPHNDRPARPNEVNRVIRLVEDVHYLERQGHRPPFTALGPEHLRLATDVKDVPLEPFPAAVNDLTGTQATTISASTSETRPRHSPTSTDRPSTPSIV